MTISFPSIDNGKAKIAILIWIAFWLYFLYVLARLWSWKRYGHEIIKIHEGLLKYKKDVKGRGWVHDYELEKIEKLRVSESTAPEWLKNMGGDFWNTDCDSIRFNYEDREMSVGYLLDQKEREKLMNVFGEFVAAEKQLSKRNQKEANWKNKSE